MTAEKPDALAIAVDWLDAYRDGDIDAILKMYAEDASIECGCGGAKVVSGLLGISAYWNQRVENYPAGELDDLQPEPEGGATISYVTRGKVVRAVIEFDVNGRIRSLRCGPE